MESENYPLTPKPITSKTTTTNPPLVRYHRTSVASYSSYSCTLFTSFWFIFSVSFPKSRPSSFVKPESPPLPLHRVLVRDSSSILCFFCQSFSPSFISLYQFNPNSNRSLFSFINYLLSTMKMKTPPSKSRTRSAPPLTQSHSQNGKRKLEISLESLPKALGKK